MSKLIISFLLLLFVSLSSMGTIAYLDAKSSMIELALEQLQMSATLKEDSLNRWLETHRKATVSLGLLPEVKTQAEVLLTRDRSSEEFARAYRQMQSLMSIAFATQSDVRDIFILTASTGKIIFSTNPSTEGQSRNADEYFIEGLKQTYVQSIYLFPATNQPTLTISTPISGENNQTLGVLAVNLNLETVAEIITQTDPDLHEEIYWVTRFKVPIYTNIPNPKKLPRRLQNQGLEAALKQKNGTHQDLNYAGETIIGVHRWLEQWNSVLLVEKSRFHVLKPVYKLATNILFAGLFLTIIFGFFIYKLVQNLTQPILTLTTAARHIADGNLKLVPVTTTDEVGILTTALNQITQQLHYLYSSLEDRINQPQNTDFKLQEASTQIQEKEKEKETLLNQNISTKKQNLTTPEKLNSQQFSQFLEAIPVGVVVLDAQGNIYYSNHVAQSLFGPGAVPEADQDAEIYPSYIAGTEQIYAEKDLPLVRALNGETVTINNIEVHQGDQIIPLESWGTPIYDEAGNIAFAIAAFQDTSERKNSETERQIFIEDLFKINCDLQLALDQEEQLNSTAERFVPHQFLTFLGYESIVDVKVGDAVQQEMSILFSDIRSFTQLSEQMSPSDNFKFINAYLAQMEPAIVKNYGLIDKYIGDAIMALFGCSADHAVQAGIDMLKYLSEFNLTRCRPDRSPVQIGIGINTGDLMLGIVGGKDRIDTTVISDAVNLAARLEKLTKRYSVPLLISENTFLALPDPTAYSLRLIDQVVVTGKSKKVSVFEVFEADSPQVRQKKLETKTQFELAITYYYQEEYQQAIQLFSECLTENPTDTVALMYWQRLQSQV
ncbi:adenylate/guanylate cyclase domain-containing protein [Lyngbya sp. PCC 8106]|uniref:adenylate/guanylate cyclase domain-containing protein n=1 Tax=Lyngbya sp. (strain PCC 8106) TaxID=313612 RepID=UPI0018DC76CB|nr:adenylate/guanylate cyclase domain-containing protein [Lyngbya sp. PCC 8106]